MTVQQTFVCNGQNIRKSRKKKNFSQNCFSKRGREGVYGAIAGIGAVENFNLILDMLEKTIEVLGISIDELLK